MNWTITELKSIKMSMFIRHWLVQELWILVIIYKYHLEVNTNQIQIIMQRSRYVTNERYMRGGSDFVHSFWGKHIWLGIALFCSSYQVIDYHIWTSLVSLTVICFGFDSMNLKHITSNLVLLILLPQNDIILWPQSQKNIQL